jgi:hypothetical protein
VSNEQDISLGTVTIAGGIEYAYTLEVQDNGINLHKVCVGTRQQGHNFFLPTEIAKALLTALAELEKQAP